MTAARTIRVDPDACTPAALARALDWLRGGGVVAFPTDTFYGLAVDPGSAAAVAALFDLKGRGAHLASPFVAASAAQVAGWCGPLAGASARLAGAWWPGPLSLVLDAPPGIVPALVAGRTTVAVRVPAHAVPRALAGGWGAPLPATSANRSGAPPAADAAALGDLAADPRVFVVDGGRTPAGEPSTIVDARGAPPVCVRAGAVAWNRVLESLER